MYFFRIHVTVSLMNKIKHDSNFEFWFINIKPPSQPSPTGEGVAQHFPLGGK
jgi:hypothetical protein